MLVANEHHVDLATLTELIDTGHLALCIDSTYTLDHAGREITPSNSRVSPGT